MDRKNLFRFRVRELRERNGYRSQKAFAEAFGVAQTTVASWEGGKREPDFNTAIRLADEFCTSVDDLICGTAIAGAPHSEHWNGSALKAIREERREPPLATANSVGIPLSTYERYESSTLDPSVADLCRLADHFCVDLDVLTGRIFRAVGSDQAERRLVNLYRSVNDEGKRHITKQAEFAATQPEFCSNPASTAKSVG